MKVQMKNPEKAVISSNPPGNPAFNAAAVVACTAPPRVSCFPDP